MRHELILAVLLLVALAGWAHRLYRYVELREAIRPHMMDRCTPEKPLRPYRLNEEMRT